METKKNNIEIQALVDNLNHLMQEKVTIGTQNRIQKILRTLSIHLKDFQKMHSELLKKHGAVEVDGKLEIRNPSKELMMEYNELASQQVTVSFDPIDFAKIENIETTTVYNYELLSDFFENY